MELQYFLIALIGALVAESNAITGQALPNRPIVLGPLVGLILGDVVQGTIIGATLELSYMGVMVIGISSAVNMTVASLLGTTYAMVTGSGPEVAVALAIPCSLLYSMVGRFYGIFRMWLVRFADKSIQAGDIKKFERWHWFLYGARFITSVPTYFIALLLGSVAVQGIVDAVPKVIMDGLQAGTMLLPALGFAMLVNLCWTKEVAAFYFIGFVLSIYAGLDNIAIAILAGAFAVIAFFFIKEEKTGDTEPVDTEVAPREHLLDKKTLKKIYWRSYTLEASFNTERFQGLGFGYMMVPAIEKLYSDPEERKEALIRQCEFFNTTPTIVTLITGIVCAMEEEKSLGSGMTAAAISNVKVALMGPSAGIGDAIFWGSYRIICASIACQLGIQGNVLAPFIFLFLFNIPNVLLHWYGLFMSYEVGSNFIKRMYQSNVMDKITLCCGIMGMTMIGAMTASLVSVKTPFKFNLGGELDFILQDTLDAILPGMLSLITVFAISRILKKQVSVMAIMLGILVVGVAGRLIGIL